MAFLINPSASHTLSKNFSMERGLEASNTLGSCPRILYSESMGYFVETIRAEAGMAYAYYKFSRFLSTSEEIN